MTAPSPQVREDVVNREDSDHVVVDSFDVGVVIVESIVVVLVAVVVVVFIVFVVILFVCFFGCCGCGRFCGCWVHCCIVLCCGCLFY